ncbi:hypothetical protein BH23ACT9_BH23ACT9_37420 [soil metagenome]
MGHQGDAAGYGVGSMAHTTLHLWRVPPRRVPGALRRMGLDRVRLRTAAGLRFHKLLGTGDGRTFSPRDADPLTWGLLCTWDDADAAAAFEGHPTPRGWRRIASEEWRADLACLRAKGWWSGRQPFTADPAFAGWSGPVASVTRARLRTSTTGTFWKAVPPVVADLAPGGDDGGPLLRVGIGEAPVGLQGTFTVWRDAAALTDFAYRRPAHRQAITDTQRLDWYAEELFARFAVLQQRGTVFGNALPLDLRP